MLTNDPKVIIRNLLVANWNSANTSGVTPKIGTGWYREEWADSAQISVGTPIENPLSGGQTGYYGTDGSGSPGGVRLVIGNVIIATWAHHDLGLSVSPKQLTFEMAEEIKRIIDANVVSISDFEWMSWVGKTEIPPDVVASPTLFRYNVSLRYMYRD